jgi:galactose mutarotase-like enzyme
MIDASEKYQKIWIWSLPDKDFICIEPVMRDVGGLVNDPQILEPKEVFVTSVNFNLEK